MSSVSELRRLTTQERLRSDHIALMEVLQASVDENCVLKAEIAKLRSSAGGVGETKEGTGPPPCHEKENAAFMLQRVLAADAIVAALTAEVKVLKAKLASADLETRALKKSNSSNESLRRELDAVLQAQRERDAREEVQAQAQAEALALERAKTLQAASASEPHAAAEAAAAATTASALAALQSRYDALERAHADLTLGLEEMRAEQACSALATEACTLRCAALEAELAAQAAQSASRERAARDAVRVQQDIEAALRDELHAQALRAEAERSAAAGVSRQLEIAAGRLRAYEDVEKHRAAAAPPPSSSFPSFSSSSSSSSSKYAASEPDAEPDNGADSSAFLTAEGAVSGGPGLFEEFVRLKRENRTLRLQLASFSGGR